MKEAVIPAGTNLSALYRSLGADYPKFFKMDTLSKLGFLLAEMLVGEEDGRFVQREDRAVLVFSREGCIADDLHYAQSMKDFPSPALFVYTLPNIVAGEIAIRNKFAGETGAYVIDGFDGELIRELSSLAFQDKTTREVLVAWIDCPSDSSWNAKAWLCNEAQINEIKAFTI